MKRVGIIFTAVFVLWHLCCGILLASPTTPYQAEKVVTSWLKADAQPLGAALGQKLKKTDVFRDEQGQVIYYIVYLQPAGFVIVPADDMVEPILGFADNGTYDPSLDNPLGAMVNGDVKRRISASRDILTTQGADAKAFRKTTSKWERLTATGQLPEGPGILSFLNISDLRVNPLLRTKWDQTTCCNAPRRACYNYYTPPFASGDPNNFFCGCVATAMAQLMRFHEHPDPCGIGKLQFQIKVNGIPQPAWTRGGDGNGGPYDWDSMVYEPNCNTTLTQRQAIGALCYDAGVTVNMDYSAAGSRAFMASTKTALKNTFTYSNVFYKSSVAPNPIPIPDLTKMINPNLDYEHPVLISIQPNEGHAVVVDGYGYNFGTMYHHINMGWSGVQDAWYNFYTDMPVTFTAVDCCVYNIFVTGTGEIISGRVTDINGTVFAGKTVTAVRTGGGTYQAVTNDRGIYVLAHVPSASTYTISVTWNGYSFGKVVSTDTSADAGTIGNCWGANDNADFVLTPLCYVDTNAPGNNDGSSWYDAYNYLQDALADPCASVILVARGTYRPDDPSGSGDRYASFVLKNGVALYGGYAGYGAPNPNARNIELYETVLSGDLAGNDVDVNDPCDLRNEPTRAENSFHVVDGNGTDASAILDGFIITAGNANGSEFPESLGGGGMLNFPSSANCTIKNCTFIENSADDGGAMFNFRSDMHISNCKFYRNSADDGGGIANKYSGSPQITNCTFSGNQAVTSGGGMSDANCSPTITNCVFSGNTAGEGAGIYNVAPCCFAIITNCTFSGNQATTFGGGIRDYVQSSATITNCILWDNTAPTGSQISDDASSWATVNYSDVQGGWAGTGNIDTDPCFADANGPDGVIGTSDDNLRLSPDSPCIDKGDNSSVPADTVDLDNDANTTEQTPLDLDLRSRFADGDCNSTIVVDMGAYEFSWAYIGDFDHDCNIDFVDYAFLASAWMENNPLMDITPPPAGDGIVDFKDLAVLCDNWLAGK